MGENFPNGLKTLWEKEKLLYISNFSFSHSIFKRLEMQTLENKGLFGKGLNNPKDEGVYKVVGKGENAGNLLAQLFQKVSTSRL